MLKNILDLNKIKVTFFCFLLCPLFYITIASKIEFVKIGIFNPYNKKIVLKSYTKDNKKLALESWNILRKINADITYDVDNNIADYVSRFELNCTKEKWLFIGNSHSKDFFNIFYYSDFSNNYQFSRIGCQIKEKLYNELKFYPDFINCDMLIISTRYSPGHSNIKYLEELIKNISHKKVVIVSAVYEFKQYNNNTFTLFDKYIHNHNMFVDQDIIKKCENDMSNEYNENYKYSDQKNYNNIIQDICSRYSHAHYFDRNKLLFNNNVIKVCDKNLNKYIYDYGHVTISGAKYYSTLLNKLFTFN